MNKKYTFSGEAEVAEVAVCLTAGLRWLRSTVERQVFDLVSQSSLVTCQGVKRLLACQYRCNLFWHQACLLIRSQTHSGIVSELVMHRLVFA